MRDTLGFANATRECDNIRKQLPEHLLIISTFFAGVRVDTPTSLDTRNPELFFALYTILSKIHIESSRPGLSTAELNLNDGDQWQTLRDNIALKSGLTSMYVDERREYVKACVERIPKENLPASAETISKDDSHPQANKDKAIEQAATSEWRLEVVAPAKPK